MKVNDIVQVRQVDGVDHWIYAKVLNVGTRLVQIQHPGNRDDGKQMTFAAADLRTKADVTALVATAQSLASNGRLSDAQIQSLGASDGWFLTFLKPHAAISRTALHTLLVQHFQNIASALS